jgi:hypothetical protein
VDNHGFYTLSDHEYYTLSDHGFYTLSDQTDDYQIGICCFSTKQTTLRSKLSFFRKQYDGDVLSYDPGSLIMEWKSEFDLDKTPSKLEKFKFLDYCFIRFNKLQILYRYKQTKNRTYSTL